MPFYSSALVPHFLSLLHILLSVVLVILGALCSRAVLAADSDPITRHTLSGVQRVLGVRCIESTEKEWRTSADRLRGTSESLSLLASWLNRVCFLPRKQMKSH